MLPDIRSVPHPGAGAGHEGSATTWTGKKRHKTIGSSTLSSPENSTDVMDIQLQEEQCDAVVGEQSRQEEAGSFVFSEQDFISLEESIQCRQKLELRESWASSSRQKLNPSDVEELRKSIIQLRFKEYLRMSKRDDSTDTVPTESEYPDEIFCYEDPCDPDCRFDWSVDIQSINYGDMDIYQAMLPTRLDPSMCHNLEQYCMTFSNYETDEEYVNYCDEIAKKIKWVEKYVHLDFNEFFEFRLRGSRQAMKIAANFPHLPLSLATRGYDEYIWSLKYNYQYVKDFDCIYFEIWKLVNDKKMSFREALKELHENNRFPARSCMIQAAIEGVSSEMLLKFQDCTKKIPKNIVDGNKVSEHITRVFNDKTGEYFLRDKKKSAKKWQEKLEKQAGKSEENKRKREAAFVPPKENTAGPSESEKASAGNNEIADIAKSLKKKAKDFKKTEAQGNVKVESYLASTEESLPKKKKHK